MTIPKHATIAEILLGRCQKLPLGTRLPSEQELAVEFGVSRMTVRQALSRLCAEGMVERIAGRGTFVRRPTVAKSSSLTSFTEDMRMRGLRPSSRLIGLDRVPATPDIAQDLALVPGDFVFAVERLRLADGEPICLELAHLPVRFEPLLVPDQLERSLHDALRTEGVELLSGTRRVHAIGLGRREAVLLELPDGAPALEVVHVFRSSGRRPVQRARSLYRSDRYEMVTELVRQPSGPPDAYRY